jgi:hypothetical protein
VRQWRAWRACVFSGRTGVAPRRSDENLPLSCSQSSSRNRSHRPCSPSRTCSAATHPCTTDAAQIARVSAQIWAGAGKGVGVILLQQRMWASHGSHVGQSHRALACGADEPCEPLPRATPSCRYGLQGTERTQHGMVSQYSTRQYSRTNISSSSPIASMWLAAVALYSSPLNASTSARPMLPQAVQRRVLHNVHAWHVAMRRGTHRPGEAICDAFILFDSEMGPLFGGTYACAESSEFGAFCHRHDYSTRVVCPTDQLLCFFAVCSTAVTLTVLQGTVGPRLLQATRYRHSGPRNASPDSRSWCRCGRLPAQSVGEARRRCARDRAKMCASPGADVGRPWGDVGESRRYAMPGRGGAGLFCHWIQLDTYRRVLEPLASRSVRGVETFIRRVRILRSNENVAYISTAVFRLHEGLTLCSSSSSTTGIVGMCCAGRRSRAFRSSAQLCRQSCMVTRKPRRVGWVDAEGWSMEGATPCSQMSRGGSRHPPWRSWRPS